MTIRITGMNSNLDTEAIITELMSAYKTKGDKYVKEQTKLSWKQDAWKSLNTKIFNFYKKTRNLTLASGYSARKSTVSDSAKATVTAGNDAMNGVQSLEITNIAKSGYLTSGQFKETITGSSKLGSEIFDYQDVSAGENVGFEDGVNSTAIKITGSKGTKEITVTRDTTLDQLVKQINDAGAGVKASFDTKNRRLYFSSEATGTEGDFSFKASDKTGENLLKMLKLTEDLGAKKTAGEDAAIMLNGVSYTSSSNTFEVNGMTINALAKTDGEVTITTATDVQGIYDKIKDFLTDYNDLMKEMSKLYNADSAKGYEPLTSEEKDAMSDSDVEMWEDKIKSSLLRRDSTLSGVMSAMSGAMLAGYDVNGKNYSLSSFGIMTLGYFEVAKEDRGLFHINGDPDDEDVSDKEEKLKAALQKEPDSVMSFFQKLSSQLYSNLDQKMKRTELSSIYTVYNDKEMAKTYSSYTDTIKEWDTKMTAIEDSYYKKFAAMEKALSKLQSQTSSLSGLLG